MLEEGEYYFHSFEIKNSKDLKTYRVLRFMSGNNLLTEKIMNSGIKYIEKLGEEIYELSQ